MKAVDVFNNQAFERGFKLGFELGFNWSCKQILQLLIETRFGQLSPENIQKIEQADLNQLDRWVKNILLVKTFGELFVE